jgi:hypothetical protein
MKVKKLVLFINVIVVLNVFDVYKLCLKYKLKLKYEFLKFLILTKIINNFMALKGSVIDTF